MNQEARDVLVGAQLQGIPQARGVYKRIQKRGFCALGLLLEELIQTKKVKHTWIFIAIDPGRRRLHYSGDMVADIRKFYEIDLPEFRRILDANDEHKWNFLEIARKIGVKEEKV